MFVKSTRFKQVCQLLLSLIVVLRSFLKTISFMKSFLNKDDYYYLSGSQCRPQRRGEMWQNLGALQTSLAEAFKTLCNLLSW